MSTLSKSKTGKKHSKKMLGMNVLEAAEQRINWTFDNFERVYLSFSGGKDSTVMLHIAAKIAKERDRKIGVLFVDLEAQYQATIQCLLDCIELHKDVLDVYWVSLPTALRNAVSQYEPKWTTWEPERKKDWVRNPPKFAITDYEYFDFYEYNMEFEDFVPKFAHWYAQGRSCACMVGIRTQESLNRWRTIAGHGIKFENIKWTNYVGGTAYNVYPIYDWTTEDIWTYHGKNKDLPYNKIYDLMSMAGLTLHQQRICQPYGDDQRKGLWLFHILEPDTWGKVVARVNGANSGALYAQENGNILGNGKVTKPEGHTWESFCMFLLDSMPDPTAEHYKNKIAIFLHWWKKRGYQSGIPDEASYEDERDKKVPSWRRVAKVLIRGDYWCKGLSFGQTKSQSYERYMRAMKSRRAEWGILE